jgi:hypothetical protein
MPEGVIAAVTVKDAAELLKDWEGSGAARFLQDEAVKKWMAPLYKDGVPLWESSFKEATGKNFSEIAKVASGSIVAGITVNMEAADESEKGGGVILMDVTGKEAEMQALQQQRLEIMKRDKEPKAVMKELEVFDYKGGKIMSDETDEAKLKSCWVVVDGVNVEASSEALLEEMVANMKSGSGHSDSLSEQIQRVSEISGQTSDMTVTMDLTAFVEMIQMKMMQDAAKQDANASPFNPAMFMGAFGMEDLRAMAFTMDLSDKGYTSDFIFSHTDGATSLLPSLFRGTGKEAEQLPVIPAGADVFSVSSYSIANIYDSLLAAVEKLGPMSAMVTGQIGAFEQKIGTTIRNDFLGSIDDTIIQLQTLPASGEIVSSAVTGFKLKDKARFQASFDAIMKSVGQGFGVFEETEVHGFKVKSMKPSLTASGPEAEALKFAFAITNDYFLFSQGKPEMLNKLLARMKSPDGPSAWEDAAVQSAIAALPKNTSSLGVTRPGAIVKAIVTMATTMQTMAAKDKTETADEDDEDDDKPAKTKPAKTDDVWFDPAAAPSDELIGRYFGATASGYFLQPDAVHVRFIAPPAEAK